MICAAFTASFMIDSHRESHNELQIAAQPAVKPITLDNQNKRQEKHLDEDLGIGWS
jgi:hypothetical protein